jgi:acetyl esterase/lipase
MKGLKKSFLLILVWLTLVPSLGISAVTSKSGKSINPGLTKKNISPPAAPVGDGRQGAPPIEQVVDQSAYKIKWLDVSYANGLPSQKLDIYLPEKGDGPFPTIIVLHGGGWAGGDKARGTIVSILKAVDRGYAVVSMNYRLSGEAKFPAQIYDVKGAIRFLRANAKKFNLKPDKVAVWGDSAGGHLAALAGTSGGVLEVEDVTMGNIDQSSKVQAVVDWYGPIDLVKMDKANSPERNLIGSPLTEVPDMARKANPMSYISKDDPPFFIQHGNKDAMVPMEQSVLFASALKKVLKKENVTLEIIEGAGHVDKAFETNENISHVLDFLDKIIK